MIASRKIRPAVKTHGGKAYLARRILAELPDHHTYVEPFAGGLSVLLNKAPARRETAGDIDPELMHFYRMLKERTADLLHRLAALPYTAETFAWSLQSGDDDNPIERAVRFQVRNRMSRGGLGKDFAWSDRLRGGQPGDLNAWQTMRAELPRIAHRLAQVRLVGQDAVQTIAESDGPGVLHYLDPPYLASTRTARDTYRHEMDEAGHRRLLETIIGCRGAVALSGYANPLYDEVLAGWQRVTWDMPNHSGQGRAKQRREEVLWLRA
jgi:DNA adenine methylase